VTDISSSIMNEPTVVDPDWHRLRDQGDGVEHYPTTLEFDQASGQFKAVQVQFEDDRLTNDAGGGDQMTAQDGENEWAPGVFFPGDNATAFPVFSRAANDFNAKARIFSPGLNTMSNLTPLVGRTKGRQSITLSVPLAFTYQGNSIAPAGVIFSSELGATIQGDGFQLNPGDSVTIYTESEVWALPIPGNTSVVAVVQYIEETNPIAGSFGTN
jgi:hypothetical protein